MTTTTGAQTPQREPTFEDYQRRDQTPSQWWSDRVAPMSTPAPEKLPPGEISPEQYHRLSPDQQARYANLRGGRWIERSKLRE